jgi:hypothetical protein
VNGSEELRLLAEIARWTREAALPIVRERVEGLLDSDAKKRVYEAIAEGTAAVSAVEKSTGVNHSDINKWVAEWQIERIVELDAKPPKAMFTLRELGISSPPARKPRKRPSSS